MNVAGLFLGIFLVKKLNNLVSKKEKEFEAEHALWLQRVERDRPWDPRPKPKWAVCPLELCDVQLLEDGEETFCSTCDRYLNAEKQPLVETYGARKLKDLQSKVGSPLDEESFIVEVAGTEFSLIPIKDLPLWLEVVEYALTAGEFNSNPLEPTEFYIYSGYDELTEAWWKMLGISPDDAEDLMYNQGISPQMYHALHYGISKN